MSAVTDLGPLDWRIGIVDKGGRPTPEFQRRWNTQRQTNGLIGVVGIGAGPPPTDTTPSDGQVYIDDSTTPWTLYAGDNGTWSTVGVINFTDLKDVPHSYTGEGGTILSVNSGATGLQFSTLTGLLDILGGSTEGNILVRGSTAWEALSAGTASDVLTSNGPGSVPSWQPASGGGGGGSRMLFNLPDMPALSSFGQLGVSGTVSVVENPGKSISLINTSPPNDASNYFSGITTPRPSGSGAYRMAIYCLSDSIAANYSGINAGWYDSSTGKIHVIVYQASFGLGPGQLWQFEFNSATSRNSASVINNMAISMASPGIWFGLRDDGAGHVFFEYSNTGGIWTPILEITKSSGWLSTYDDQIVLGATWDDNDFGGIQQSVSFFTCDPNGLSRVVG